jgi:hypothetical protein
VARPGSTRREPDPPFGLIEEARADRVRCRVRVACPMVSGGASLDLGLTARITSRSSDERARQSVRVRHGRDAGKMPQFVTW